MTEPVVRQEAVVNRTQKRTPILSRQDWTWTKISETRYSLRRLLLWTSRPCGSVSLEKVKARQTWGVSVCKNMYEQPGTVLLWLGLLNTLTLIISEINLEVMVVISMLCRVCRRFLQARLCDLRWHSLWCLGETRWLRTGLQKWPAWPDMEPALLVWNPRTKIRLAGLDGRSAAVKDSFGQESRNSLRPVM